MVQVGNKPLLVLIDNPISQSVMFFFLSLPIAITNGSTWSFRSIKTCYHAETFRLQIVYGLSPQVESANFFVFGVRDLDNVARADAPRCRSGCYEAGSGRCLSSVRREGGVD